MAEEASRIVEPAINIGQPHYETGGYMATCGKFSFPEPDFRGLARLMRVHAHVFRPIDKYIAAFRKVIR
jgi:hypothetical protein